MHGPAIPGLATVALHEHNTFTKGETDMRIIMRNSMYLPMAAVLLTAALASPAVADDGAEGKENVPTCTLKTLKGRYLFADKGTILPPAFGVTAPTPGSDAGFHLFNGDGTGT